MIRDQFEETIVEKPPEGWTLGHVTLDLHYPDERLPVEAWRRGAFALHIRHGVEGKEAIITHVPTGMRINPHYSFQTLDGAAECAEKLEPLANWDSIKKAMGSGSDLYPKVRSIIDAVKQHHQSPQGTASEV
jgi:hypothetical protein